MKFSNVHKNIFWRITQLAMLAKRTEGGFFVVCPITNQRRNQPLQRWLISKGWGVNPSKIDPAPLLPADLPAIQVVLPVFLFELRTVKTAEVPSLLIHRCTMT